MRITSKVVVGLLVAVVVITAVALAAYEPERGTTPAIVRYATGDVAGRYELNRTYLKESILLRADNTFVYAFATTESGANDLNTTGTYRLVNGRVKCHAELEDWQYAIGDDARSLIPVVSPGSTLNVGRTLTRVD